ncbi:SixA phosphatase family protein [Algicella marina]|uniref:Histidine phosphatase family protein n=1 Tax=Algicella marina TaxID=2683284 RepID=A0A6P1SWX1_9RHOB|nr:histidine phosphatase family protein [Algicella marina]QHQ33833.1 histidine phosphatase family protein [Algicella marina]
MKRLILLRHTKSDWKRGAPDHERPLNHRGRKAAAAVGHYLAAEAPKPDLALVSDAARTRETWEKVNWQGVETSFRSELYLATERSILALIQAQDDALGSLLVLGHNPGIGNTAARLTNGFSRWSENDADSHTETIPNPYQTHILKPFPTGACVIIESFADTWALLEPENCRLVAYQVPRNLP